MIKTMILFVCLLLAAPAGPLFARKDSWLAGIEGGPGLSLIYGNQSIYSQSEFSLAGAAGIFGD